jgi:hypothetical protein
MKIMSELLSLRRLKDSGIEEFFEFINKKRAEGSVPVPSHLITDLEKSEDMYLDVKIDPEKRFSNRFEFGTYLLDKIRSAWNENFRVDGGLWTWLSLVYFDQLCPKKGPSKPEHYILTVGKWRIGCARDYSYRHSVLTPVRIIKDFNDYAEFFLCGTTDKPADMTSMGDAVEQVFSNQSVMRNKNLLDTVLSLYQDNQTKRVKKGAMSDPKIKLLKSGQWSQVGKGGARRLITRVIPRLQLTYNVAEIAPNGLLKIAGGEFTESKFFNKFK